MINNAVAEQVNAWLARQMLLGLCWVVGGDPNSAGTLSYEVQILIRIDERYWPQL